MKPDLEADVKKVPLFETRDIYITPKEEYVEQEDFRGISEKDDDELISVVSDQYELVQIRGSFLEVLKHMPEEIEGDVHYYKDNGWGGLKIFPMESDIGVWVTNSVDGSGALKVHFIYSAKEGDIFIPQGVKGYKRVHRGEIETEFDDFLDVIEEVRGAWQSIVSTLSKKGADSEDIEAMKNIVGSRAGKKIDEYLKQKRLNPDGTINKDWHPSIWELMLVGIKVINKREYTSGIHKEDKIRKICSSIYAYALKN